MGCRIMFFCNLNRQHAMRTTVEVPDDLYRRAKAEAALRGGKFGELVEGGLLLALEARWC